MHKNTVNWRSTDVILIWNVSKWVQSSFEVFSVGLNWMFPARWHCWSWKYPFPTVRNQLCCVGVLHTPSARLLPLSCWCFGKCFLPPLFFNLGCLFITSSCFGSRCKVYFWAVIHNLQDWPSLTNILSRLVLKCTLIYVLFIFETVFETASIWQFLV